MIKTAAKEIMFMIIGKYIKRLMDRYKYNEDIGYFTLRTSKTSKVAEKFMIKPNEHEENQE